MGRISNGPVARQSYRRFVVALWVCVTVCLSSPYCRAEENFRFVSRGAVGHFKVHEDAQLVEWIGPGAIEAPWPVMDRGKKTGLMFRVVPDGMKLVRKACAELDSDITALALRAVKVTDADIDFLAQACPNLKTLVLQAAETLQEDELSDLTENERQSLDVRTLHGIAFKALSQFRKLESLEINGYSLPPEGVEFLQQLKQLEVLKLLNMSVVDNDLARIGQLTSLDKLCLHRCQITATGLRNLKNCAALTCLSLKDTAVDDDFALVVQDKPFPRLEHLAVINSKMTASGIQELKRLLPFATIAETEKYVDGIKRSLDDDPQRLRQYRAAALFLHEVGLANVEIVSNAITGITILSRSDHSYDWILAHVALVDELPALYLPMWHATKRGLLHLQSLVSLEVLNCDGASLDDDAISRIAELKSLRALVLSNTRVTDSGIKHLTRLGSLQIVVLDYSDIGDQSLEALATLPKLQKLTVAGCRVSDTGARHLLNVATLRAFDLSNTNVSSQMVRELQTRIVARVKAAETTIKARE